VNPAEIRRQAAIDQAREELADVYIELRDGAPESIISVCEAIEAAAGLGDISGVKYVQIPIPTYCLMAQFAAVGIADTEATLMRRKDEQ